MKNSQEVLNKANIVPLLRLAVQKEGGGVIGTGPHKVKLLEDKTGTRVDRNGRKRYVLWYIVEEKGQKKRYPVWLYSDENTKEVHYLIQRLAEFEEGEEIILEYKRRGGSAKGYIDARSAKEQKTEEMSRISDEDIPVVEDENYEEQPSNPPEEELDSNL